VFSARVRKEYVQYLSRRAEAVDERILLKWHGTGWEIVDLSNLARHGFSKHGVITFQKQRRFLHKPSEYDLWKDSSPRGG
jgi:hypothetical protein